MATWKKQLVKPNRILWTKGDERYGDFIYLDKAMPNQLKMFPNDRYTVGARRKINSQTINGHFKSYKTKQSALNLIKRYLAKH